MNADNSSAEDNYEMSSLRTEQCVFTALLIPKITLPQIRCLINIFDCIIEISASYYIIS